MKTFLICIAFAFVLCSYDSRSQCGMISLIGEFNSWNGDLFLTRDPVVPEEFSRIIVLTAADDQNLDGIVEMKFRENADWVNNWGATFFPNGTAVLNGPNIPVPIGSYLVTFNCNTLEYYFQSTCGMISVIGEFSGWMEDIFMTRDQVNPDLWTADLSFNEGSNSYDPPNIIDVKFRQNADWAVNWGATDFPWGIGYQDGPNIPVPLTYTGITTDYMVTFNCATGEYYFAETSGPISLIGEFNNWAGDLVMTRDANDPSLWSTYITLTPESNYYDPPEIIEMKFRENADWTVNWGATDFPVGIGILNGYNIPVPLDETGLTTDYFVTFNGLTNEYSFEATSGPISIIGAFNGWAGDVPLNRDPGSPHEWTLTRSWFEDSGVKFRENQDWMVNWGDDSWPSGIGVPSGPNIPLIAGTYDVTFNASTGAYNFVDNPDACGEIGMVGDFNNWGGNGDFPSDVYLIRDPVYPSQFSLDYLFPTSTDLLFRMDADPTFTDIWGGNSLCQTGVQDISSHIPVNGGYYHITFDCNSGDYCFTSLGASTEAPNVLGMVIDGMLEELEWDISVNAGKIIDGTPLTDLNEVVFGITYSESNLYVGVNVTDAYVYYSDMVEIFVDGDRSGGDYDEHDVHFMIDTWGNIYLVSGPPGGITIDAVYIAVSGGYNMEVAIPWDALGITPVEGAIAGFDIFVWDDDLGTVEYKLAWSGTIENSGTTSAFGTVLFGPFKGGFISLYNPVLGDIILSNPTGQPSTYVATYNFDADFNVVFRKDKADYFSWGSDEFPSGTAVLGGPEIPVLTGRYRIIFDCLTGFFSFENAPAGSNVAMAYYSEDPPYIDGVLDEYDLEYDCNILTAGSGPINNTVNWGARWDMGSFYIGVQVTDEYLFGTGFPWDNDAVEFYIDGNNDKDVTYDWSCDQQVILDYLNQSIPWYKTDLDPLTNYEASWTFTGLGYNVEMRFGWDNFDFAPGRGRVMGWSLGNNDNDYNAGRDYQSVWYGTGNNWSNTADLGDLQLADGPYTRVPEVRGQGNALIYPNPTSGAFYILLKGNDPGEKVHITVADISGRLIFGEQDVITGENSLIRLNLERATPGLYIVHIYSNKRGNFAKKLIIQ